MSPDYAEYKRALNNDRYCGDLSLCWSEKGITRLMIADGLGHGKYAEAASLAAAEFIKANADLPLEELFSQCDQAIRHTRGIAMGMAEINETNGRMIYAGIGNTRAVIVSTKISRLNSCYGIIGGGYRKLVTEEILLSPGDLVLMFTDGIRERMDIRAYQELFSGDLGRMARQILEDWSVSRDDAAVLIYRKG